MNKIYLYAKFLFAFLFIFSFLAPNVSDKPGTGESVNYSKVKIFIKNDQDKKAILREDLFFDHAESVEGEFLETWLSESEINKLKKSGVPYLVVIPDWEEYYILQEKMSLQQISEALLESDQNYNVSHSIYGTMGGYLTFNEVINKLDSMRIEYPNLISAKFSIGNSTENRPMWTVRLSNSPNAPTGRPETWFHSLIHAREPMSMEQNIYFMYWLLENYNIDPIATYILNYRELYFTPVFNPDGYEYNRSTNPTGGGFWRKNRSVNGGGGFGVDLNRNFGIYQFWNSTNNGSSTSPSSDTYRGTSPFSEPETRNARDFVISRNFKGVLSYHTYGNYLIRPWGYVDAPTPDENIFQNFCQDMILHNHYTTGRSNQTVAYGVRGVTDDWYYNDSAHSKIIAMTPEVGTSTDGFWPPQSRILPLAQQNVWQNQYFALACGPYVAPLASTLNKEQYSQGEQGNLKVNFKNKGLLNAQNVKIELTSQNPLITIQTGTYSYPNISSYNIDSLTFNFTVAATVPLNSSIKTTLRVRQNDTNTVYIENINVCIGNGVAILLDSAENGITRWTASGGWGLTTSQFYSPSNSFADSPTGNYGNSTNRTLTLTSPLNISASPVVILSFWYKHNIDVLDNAYVDVSNNNGANWQSAKFYTGISNSWTKQILDISTLANNSNTMKIRFSLVSNGTVAADGIFIDNIKLVGYNAIPTEVINFNEVPLKYSLQQNYPNPFNPGTVITYQLAVGNYVSLKVFDVLGKEIVSLVNERQDAGSYSVNFDGSNLPSGLYYYKIETENFADTKKMFLIK